MKLVDMLDLKSNPFWDTGSSPVVSKEIYD